MKKASVTIFATLSMVLVMSVLFSLLEGMRFQEMRRISKLQTELALESFFANYHSNLWKEYDLLGSEETTILAQLTEGGNARNIASEYGLNLFQTQVKSVECEATTRITDGEGRAYVHAVSSYMEDQILYETIKDLYNQYEAIKLLTKSGEINLSKIDEALQQVQLIQSQVQREKSSETESLEAETEGRKDANFSQIENPLEAIKDLQKVGILELVISDSSMLSDKEIMQAGRVSKRKLETGKQAQVTDVEWIDRVLFQQYLLSHFSNFRNLRENTCLSYELEYILNGNHNDIENLKAVVQQLLGVREIINFLYLLSDVQAQEEAGLLALTLVGATVNPVVIETVKIGILTAWAFGESILDVRALLSGKKIPLLKSKATWTLAISDFAHVGQKDFMSKESAVGITYENYLGILLLFQKEETLAMHAMDIQEITMRNKYKELDFRMDHLCIQAEVSMTYIYRPMFLIFQTLPFSWVEEIPTKAKFSYY